MAVVTISASFGSGGSWIAPAVARRLKAPFVDRAIPVSVAERLAVPLEEALARDESAGGLLGRMISSIAAANALYPPAPLEHDASNERYQRETERLIRESAETGSVVLLGRAAALVLADLPGALHVRLDGPPEARERQAAAFEGVDRAEVGRLRRENDRARESYVRHFYRCDPRDARHYHLVIDSTALHAPACVDLICAAAAARAPAAAQRKAKPSPR